MSSDEKKIKLESDIRQEEQKPSVEQVPQNQLDQIPYETIKEALIKCHSITQWQEDEIDLAVLRRIRGHTNVYKPLLMMSDKRESSYRVAYVVNYCGHLILYNEIFRIQSIYNKLVELKIRYSKDYKRYFESRRQTFLLG